MPRVEIIDVTPVQVKTPDGTVTVYSVCYRYGDVVSRCVWIDEKEFSEERIKELIKRDLESYLKMPRGEISV